MSITDWPLQERPREKLLERGAVALSDAELIAILLRSGIKGKTAVDIARELLAQHGGLRALFNASANEIRASPGLGLYTFAHLQAVKELGKRYVQESVAKEEILKHMSDTKQYMHSKLHDYEHEVFVGLFLDNRHRVIKFMELFQGTLNQAVVHPREIVKYGLYYNAAAMIVGHNHPSGDLTPSKADLDITKQLKEALALVDITLLDHILVGEKKSVSFAELGYL